MKKKASNSGKDAFALMSEALSLFKAGGGEAALLYYVGTLPFILAFLFFWSDMARGAFAAQRMLGEALGMTAAFVWMKVWQSFFCRRLYELRTGREPTGITPARFGNILINQTTVQPWGLILIPLSMLLILPFGTTHAFFQNCSVLDDGGGSLKDILRRARRQAGRQSFQNHIIIWVLSPWLLGATMLLCFGCAAFLVSMLDTDMMFLLGQEDLPWLLLGVLVLILGVWPACPLAVTVALNFGLLFWTAPHLLNSLFGVETLFVRGGIHSIANTTALLTLYGLTYMVLDPVMKAGYVLRCFYGDSRRSGADLLADLKRVARVSLAIIVFAVCSHLAVPPTASCTEPPPPAVQRSQKLEQAIELTLQQEEYSWRTPRKKLEVTVQWSFLEDVGDFFRPVFEVIGKALDWVAEKVGKLFDWIGDLFKSDKPDKAPSQIDFSGKIKPIVLLLACLSVLLAIWQLFKTWKNRPRRPKQQAAPAVAATPDLTGEDLTADLLPEQEWLDLARQMLNENKLRLALRAFYLAGLASLGHYRIIGIEPYKSNREYGREIKRYAATYPELPALFQVNCTLFEKVWYGDYPVGRDDLTFFQENQNRIRGYFADSQTS